MTEQTKIRIENIKKLPQSHLVTSLRNSEKHHFDSPTLRFAKSRFKNHRMNDDYIQFLPNNFKQLDTKLFCSAIPTTVEELQTIKDYFNIDVFINLNLCPLNPYFVYNIEQTKNELHFFTRYVEMEITFPTSEKLVEMFEIYNLPIPHEYTPSSTQIKRLQRIFKECEKQNKKVCLLSFYGTSRCYLAAGIYYHLFSNMSVLQIRERVEHFQKSILSNNNNNLSMEQSFYLYQNQNFPLNGRFDQKSFGIYSKGNILKREISYIRDIFKKYDSYRIPGNIIVRNHFRLVVKKENHFLENKTIRRVCFQEVGRTFFDYSVIKLLFYQFPKYTVQNTLLNYENLYNEMVIFHMILNGKDYKDMYYSYWEVLFDVSFRNSRLTFEVEMKINDFKKRIQRDKIMKEKLRLRKDRIMRLEARNNEIESERRVNRNEIILTTPKTKRRRYSVKGRPRVIIRKSVELSPIKWKAKTTRKRSKSFSHYKTNRMERL